MEQPRRARGGGAVQEGELLAAGGLESCRRRAGWRASWRPSRSAPPPCRLRRRRRCLQNKQIRRSVLPAKWLSAGAVRALRSLLRSPGRASAPLEGASTAAGSGAKVGKRKPRPVLRRAGGGGCACVRPAHRACDGGSSRHSSKSGAWGRRWRRLLREAPLSLSLARPHAQLTPRTASQAACVVQGRPLGAPNAACAA